MPYQENVEHFLLNCAVFSLPALPPAGMKTVYAAVGEGFAQITPGRISILTDMVARESEIDEDTVAKAIERAQTALANSANMSDEEASAAEAGLKRNLAMLGVKRRRRSA
jgi:F0F1-type ATP synthase epsilon subunit